MLILQMQPLPVLILKKHIPTILPIRIGLLSSTELLSHMTQWVVLRTTTTRRTRGIEESSHGSTGDMRSSPVRFTRTAYLPMMDMVGDSPRAIRTTLTLHLPVTTLTPTIQRMTTIIAVG